MTEIKNKQKRKQAKKQLWKTITCTFTEICSPCCRLQLYALETVARWFCSCSVFIYFLISHSEALLSHTTSGHFPPARDSFQLKYISHISKYHQTVLVKDPRYSLSTLSVFQRYSIPVGYRSGDTREETVLFPENLPVHSSFPLLFPDPSMNRKPPRRVKAQI